MSRQAIPSRRWLTLQEAADRLGITERSVRNFIARGDLPGYRLSTRSVRVDANDVDALLRPIPTTGVGA